MNAEAIDDRHHGDHHPAGDVAALVPTPSARHPASLGSAVILMAVLLPRSHDSWRFTAQAVESDDSGEEREQQGDRHDQEDDRHHHRDLLARAGLDQRALRRLADVGGLRVEHVDQRCAALDRDRESSANRDDDRQTASRCAKASRAAVIGTPVRDSASTTASSSRKRAAAAGRRPRGRAHRPAFAGRDRQREQIGDDGELGQHLVPRGVVPARLNALSRAKTRATNAARDADAAATASRRRAGGPARAGRRPARRRSPTSPHATCESRNSLDGHRRCPPGRADVGPTRGRRGCVRAGRPAVRAIGRTSATRADDGAGSTAVAATRQTGMLGRRGRRGRTAAPAARGRRDPSDASAATSHQARAEHGAEQSSADDDRAHRSTRRSLGEPTEADHQPVRHEAGRTRRSQSTTTPAGDR